MKKSYQRELILVILLLFLLLYFMKADTFKLMFLDYTKLFFNNLFPTSFPFFIISSLLIDFGLIELISLLFPNSVYLYVFILSIFSGFPSGAKYSKDLFIKEKVSKKTASKLLIFSHFPNPFFLLGSVSSIIGKSLSYKILIAIFISNFILFLSIKKEKNEFSYLKNSSSSFSNSLSNSIIDAIKIMVLIYGTSIFFYLLSLCITQYIILPPILYVFICGVFDLTKGIFSTTILSNQILSAYFILIFLSFGSLSIHLQVKGIIDNYFSYYSFLKGRIIGTIISIILFTILIY